MNLCFISNKSVLDLISDIEKINIHGHQFSEPISTSDTDFNINDMLRITPNDTIFVIDVHCKFKEEKGNNEGEVKLQEYGGVIVYRHLLKKYSDYKNNGYDHSDLKVIFYSPVSKVDLVKLKPENYILNLLPFVKCEYDGKFELKETIDYYEEKGWPQFNNASENLLSGWAFLNKESIKKNNLEKAKINLKGKKVLIIDDEWQQWQHVYCEILNGSVDYFLSYSPDIKSEFKKLNTGEFSHLNEKSLLKFDLIISDLYLWENHEINIWKTDDFINSISGIILFKLIRKIEPAIPVIFHTTSTKFRIFETLVGLGSEGQISKNINHNTSLDTKEDNYKLLQRKLEEIVNDYSDCWLNDFFRFIQNEDLILNKWWRVKIGKNSHLLEEVRNIIKCSILAFKQLKIYNKEYYNLFFDNPIINPIALSVSGIINNLGKIKELLRESKNPELMFVFNLRHQASHDKNYHLYDLNDLKIILVLLYQTFHEEEKRKIPEGLSFDIPFEKRAQHKFAHQFFHYIHYYNNWKEYIPSELEFVFKKRMANYINYFYSNNWINYNEKEKRTIHNKFKNIKLNTTINKPFEVKFTTNKQIILEFKF